MRNITAIEVLIDTNIVLDWALDRVPFAQAAEQIMDICLKGKVQGHLALHTLLNFFYIARGELSVEERAAIMILLCENFDIVEIDVQMILGELDRMNLKDLEDALQIACAIKADVDYIITRDTKGFERTQIRTVLPEDFLKMTEDSCRKF